MPLDDQQPFYSRTPQDRRAPLFMVPAMVTALAGAISAISILVLVSPATAQAAAIWQLALWPQRAIAALGGNGDLANAAVLPLFGHALLHADWKHLGVNMLWLIAFGSPVARRLSAFSFPGGRARAWLVFAAFFFGAVAAGGVMQVALDSRLQGYLLGASGGVTGLLGGLLRFGFRTREQAVADPLGFLPLTHQRLLTIAAVVVGLEILMGGLASKIGLAPANVGWEAHVGGFLFGLTMFPVFARLAAPPLRP